MRRLIAGLLGVAVGGGGMFAAFQYHFVRTEMTYLVVRKQKSDWHDAYVDIRGWTHHEWGAHRDLSNDLIAAGRGDLVSRSVTDEFFRGLFDPFRDSSTNSRSSGSPHSK
jgi:hypothetical protein